MRNGERGADEERIGEGEVSQTTDKAIRTKKLTAGPQHARLVVQAVVVVVSTVAASLKDCLAAFVGPVSFIALFAV